MTFYEYVLFIVFRRKHINFPQCFTSMFNVQSKLKSLKLALLFCHEVINCSWYGTLKSSFTCSRTLIRRFSAHIVSLARLSNEQKLGPIGKTVTLPFFTSGIREKVIFCLCISPFALCKLNRNTAYKKLIFLWNFWLNLFYMTLLDAALSGYNGFDRIDGKLRNSVQWRELICSPEWRSPLEKLRQRFKLNKNKLWLGHLGKNLFKVLNSKTLKRDLRDKSQERYCYNTLGEGRIYVPAGKYFL